MIRPALTAIMLFALTAPAYANFPSPIPSDIWWPQDGAPVVTQDKGGI
ncbi:MAG: hypothetical protein VXZ18_06790 [Pseudomonadota bacterium]|jgi:hypothetical protein|uniref:Uncharacterized protein n=1 Tax=Thalassococcus halodurans TaxID=373675 RepID=A0A1H5UIA4_9RHOB|nr:MULTISPECIES: hypothetical protein [Thalassococcus]MBO6866247.1 hypothetical protein [Thalassococcus sp.]MEC7670160.1 hypothetical protein [Pseudomonadota bacterium]MEC8580439.1 hypothetical protein [Pseudomonadota bacterium]SEF74783.1 hypothetical protein SAMN04488045_1030 [Thalassococcus halodurans]